MMQKLDKQLHELHAKRLQAILNAQSSFVPHLNRPEFNTLLKLELNTLAEIEKKLPDDKLDKSLSSSALCKQFTTLTKTEFKLGEKFKYDDEGDLIDNVNYLPTYCKNIFKVNLDDAVKGKKIVAENPNIDLRGKPDIDEGPMMDAAAAFNMGAMGYSANPYENPYLMGKAYAKLNKDIASGNVYQYKSKPKQIPLIKWISIILMILIGIACVVSSVFAFMSNGINCTNSKGEAVSGNPFLTDGIFYIIATGFIVYTTVVTFKSVLKTKGKINENKLYSFSWYFYLADVILVLIISLTNIGKTWSFENYYGVTVVDPTCIQFAIGIQAQKYMLIVNSALAGLLIVPMVIGAIKAPKVDKQRLEGILKQYIDQESKFGPAPTVKPGAEVQKPVDVKPTDKKETKDSKPKSDKPKK